MKTTRRNAAVIMAASTALLTLELLVALAAAPHVRGALRNESAQDLLAAGRTLLRTGVAASTASLTGLAADVAVHSVRQASALYLAVLRLGPRAARADEQAPTPAHPTPTVECRFRETECPGKAARAVPAVSERSEHRSRLWSRMLTAS